MTKATLFLTMLTVGAALAWLSLPLLLALARRTKNPMPDAREKTLLAALGAAALPASPRCGLACRIAPCWCSPRTTVRASACTTRRTTTSTFTTS